jgi:hypothetical protein
VVAFVPVKVKAGVKPGAYPFRVKATAAVDGGPLVRYGTLLEAVKANFGGMANPPPYLLSGCALGALGKSPFTIVLTPDPGPVEKGKSGKIAVAATREKGADSDIVLAPLFINPPTAAPTMKPIPKDQSKGEIAVAVQPATPLGPVQFVFRVTTKVGGKDYASILPAVTINVIEAKKVEPKKEEPKKVEPKKDPPKKVEPKKK